MDRLERAVAALHAGGGDLRVEDGMGKKPARVEERKDTPEPQRLDEVRLDLARAAGADPDDVDPDDADDTGFDALGSTRVLPIAAEEEAESDLGDFALIKRLGEGAMGVVYKARQRTFDRVVALKVLFPHVASNPKLVERLYREGRVMGQLEHPNIVEAYAIGEHNGCHYVAMEYVAGQSMQKWVEQVGRLSVGDAVHVILACCRALSYAHANGIIHRDVKPDNILVTRKGVVKVADLGMAKSYDEDMSLTQTGHAVGTPWYMPLEQARNAKEIDGRSDVYALGCTLYCLLVGHPPFVGRTLVEVIQAKEQGTFPPSRQFNKDVPERLDYIIDKMAAKQAKYRYQNCEEVIADLEALGLANDWLTFVGGATPSGEGPVATLPAPSSADATLERAAEGDPDLWFVLCKNSEGKTIARKHTTGQLHEMLRQGTLNASARAGRGKPANFRALATFKEFAAAATRKIPKVAADGSTIRYRNLVRNIEEKERRLEVEQNRKPPQLNYRILALALGSAGVGVLLLGMLLYWIATGFGR